MLIRPVNPSDIDTCQQIAWKDSANVGFVRRDKLGETFVAEHNGQVVGFVNYHARQDGWQTVYHLAVHPDFRGQGFGRALLYAVPCPIELRVKQDNAVANQFYVNAGMRLIASEPGKKSPLNVYQLRILSVIVRGARKGVADLARRTGMAYGVRHDCKAEGWPFMVDINWEKVKKCPDEWDKVVEVVRKTRPVVAMVQDWEPEIPLETIQRQIADLRNLGLLRIMVCPKQDGIMSFIPADCIIAVSIPSSYAGYLPDPTTLKGRLIHLLGGTPDKQKEYIVKYTGHGGRVISVDGNKHIGVAQVGTTWSDGSWRKAKRGERVDIAACSFYSGHHIQRELNAAAEYEQMPLW